jgi:hypothetical protein
LLRRAIDLVDVVASLGFVASLSMSSSSMGLADSVYR